ncbi:hypothetical protein L7F22_034717 [Adiantum nelumboides]|nr:hypothetical protein [Adiantum nelumboides]
MLGALPREIIEVTQEAGKAVERTTIGFVEEDQRAKRWKTSKPGLPRALPQGDYIFCEFRTLQLPGVELNPPAGRALEIMHKLASDPGIVAIMKEHRWRVGVMTEMAPLGYVGISPKCILGFNKNQGEEISLRLRTDDLKGFRKYASIKQTLLHELAHMVHSEHDAHFHALNKQLNEEAVSLDWTKSGGQSLDGFKSAYDSEEEEDITDAGGVFTRGGHKLGGSKEHTQLGARSAAALAALLRLSNCKESDQSEGVEVSVRAEGNEMGSPSESGLASKEEPHFDHRANKEPHHDILQGLEVDSTGAKSSDGLMETMQDLSPSSCLQMGNMACEQESSFQANYSSGCESSTSAEIESGIADPELTTSPVVSCDGEEACGIPVLTPGRLQLDRGIENIEQFEGEIERSLEEDSSLKLLQESSEKVCQKINDALLKLKAEASPLEAAATIQSLYKILRNLIEHPNEEKFKRLRKANAAFKKRIAKFEGAIEVLQAIGFSEEAVLDSTEDYLVLKRNDPVLLWLAQSSLEASIA